MEDIFSSSQKNGWSFVEITKPHYFSEKERKTGLKESYPLFPGTAVSVQEWSEQPKYQEVNPHGSVVMPCVILEKKGECRWERDGNPVGIFPGKYEWSGSPETGDCSLRILDANLEYDDGVWQCQVTPSSFATKDSLISEGAELVVRGKFVQNWPKKAQHTKVIDSFPSSLHSVLEILMGLFWQVRSNFPTKTFHFFVLIEMQKMPYFFQKRQREHLYVRKYNKSHFSCLELQKTTVEWCRLVVCYHCGIVNMDWDFYSYINLLVTASS